MSPIPNLVAEIYSAAERRIRKSPARANYASRLGGPCTRMLVYERVASEHATPPTADLQLLFEEGGLHEEYVKRTLSSLGFTIVEQQSVVDWFTYQITGRIDAVVVVADDDGRPHGYPLEIKSMSPYVWKRVARYGPGVYEYEAIADHFDGDPWLRTYVSQLQLYMLLRGSEHGILICKNRASGAIAQVNMILDYELCESLLKRAEEINKHVENGTLPDRIHYDPRICPRCAFVAHCLPDLDLAHPLAFVDHAEIAKMLQRREELQPLRKEYEEIDSQVKEWAKAQTADSICVEDWLLQVERGPRRTTVSIEKLRSDGGDDG